MKIVCEKGSDVKKMLHLVRHLLDAEYPEHSILKEDLVLDMALTDLSGRDHPSHEKMFYLSCEDLRNAERQDSFLTYYDCDTLTKLYNRTKYEQDIARLQLDEPGPLTCVYIDAVGLHEINNHLGHTVGDHMLCSIAEGIRQNFSQSFNYRIGGDEFVIFCFHGQKPEIERAIAALRDFLKQDDYEISVGFETNEAGMTLTETINRAEQAMRNEKMEFYQKNGAERQIRMMNYKLEAMLLEKQDAAQFLNAIASDYKGVYIVDPVKDSLRYIYIPIYFQNFLEASHGRYSEAIQMYCTELVCEEDQAMFRMIVDFDFVRKQLKRGERIGYTYKKKDGSKVHLQITMYDPNSLGAGEMLWIFMDMD